MRLDILMATYNGEDYIAGQIASIQSQSFNDWRLFISDDCSSDGTLNIAKMMSSTDQRICVVPRSEPSGGVSNHFLQLLTESDSAYFAFSDQDDIWKPKKLELSFAEMNRLEKEFGKRAPVLVYSDMVVVDENLNVLSDSFFRYSGKSRSTDAINDLAVTNIVAGCTMMGNRALRELVLDHIDLNFVLMHDWWIALVAASCGIIHRIDYPSVLYRQHSSNVVGAERYDLWKKIENFREDSIAKYAAGCMQSKRLVDLLGDHMSPTSRHILSAHAKELEGGMIHNARLIYANGLQKHGLAKQAAQVLTGHYLKSLGYVNENISN